MPPKAAKKKRRAKARSPSRGQRAMARPVEAAEPAKEDLFAKAFRASPHPIGITELDTGLCLEINDSCLEIFGFRRDEVIGKTTLMLGIWPDPHDRARFIERLKSEGSVRNLEVSMRVKNGDLRQFLISTDLITLRGKQCLLTIGNDITERKQAESALREIEQRFRAIYDQTYEFIGLLKPDGTLLDANRTALAFRGLQLADVVGKPFWETPWWDISRELQEKLKAAIAEAASGRFVHIQVQHRAADGAIEDIDFSLTPITDRNGKVTEIIPEGRRITALTRTQDQLRQAHEKLEGLVQERAAEYDKAIESLRKSEVQLQGMLDHSPGPIFLKDLQGRYLDANKQFERTFHLTRQDIIGKTDHDIFLPEHATAYRANDLEVLKAGRSLQFEEVALHDDGLHTNIVSKFPLRRLDGTPYAVCGIATDITERKRAEQAIREREALTGAFLNNSATVAWMKDAEGRHIYISPSFERRFHVRLEDWWHKTDFDLWPREIAEQFRKNDLAVLRQNSVIEVVEEANNPDGSRSWWLSHKFPYQDASGKRYVGGLGVDITERKRAQEVATERARLSAFAAEVSLSLNRDEPLNSLLQHFTESLTSGLEAAFARIWVLEPGDLCKECYKADWCKDRTQCLHLHASAGLSTNLNGEFRRVPLGALKIGRIAQGAGVMTTNDVLRDDRLPNKQWIEENGLQSFAGFPLVVEGRVFGVLALFGRAPFSKEVLETIESVSHGLATAIARKQAEEALHQNQLELHSYQTQLEELTSKLLTAQDNERKRIARDLHDDFSQRLAVLVLDVAALEQRPPLLPELIAKSLEPVREQLEQLSDDIHKLAYTLHPTLLEHAGLQPAVEDHIHKMTERTGLHIVLKANDVPAAIRLEWSTCLFRVLQESLQNVVKHANATEVLVKLSGSSKGIGLSVADNGKGFDMRDMGAHQKGLGLISMQERLRLLNGFLRVHSRPADGTKVCAWIPSQGSAP